MDRSGASLICFGRAMLAGVLSIASAGTVLAASTPAQIDDAALSAVTSLHGGSPTVIAHVDLTKPFDTKSQWTLVVAKEPDEMEPGDDFVSEQRPASVCFVKNGVPDCSEKLALDEFRAHAWRVREDERPFYALFASDIVHSGRRRTRPLLRLKTCTQSSINGNCGVLTILFDYDRSADSFRPVFVRMTGRNNNEETRFIDHGPLIGAVVVAYPTANAPFAYHVEVYERDERGLYVRRLKYRSRTKSGDGNRLAVIDSEMPLILQRQGRWKPGGAIPTPARRPAGCETLVMRNGTVWCK